MTRAGLLARTMVELAESVGDEFDSLDFLNGVVLRSTELVGASAAGLVLADPRGAPDLVMASPHQRRVLDLLSLGVSDGPWGEVIGSGRPVVNLAPDEARRRWPRFVAAADAQGLGTTHVVPVRLGAEALGALGLLFEGGRLLEDDDLAVCRAMAAVALVALLQERTPRQKEILAEQLRSALTHKVTVEQAKGVVAERLGVDVDQAHALIAGFGRRHRRRLSAIAGDLLNGSIDARDLSSAAVDDPPRP